ncbi:S-adenosyl-L-methionine:benzoic acid/salicylic acid carboxyl methyltransferase 3-like [Tripterygium wilfordii]|uniref:S-adenosyl-L-methionine:benzoic acid/salicylic acid carboxyl methyltransferase 3-like n=1 Tax=Tripterygium wilfordii TaxID=458696 RepID=UPI0018F7F121|nr:S-adenosyl-L-methionine:benzoic acid/salicylic acid carboxyl methyltransferase 3-like [Tripterygium wilfordii]
MEKASKEMQQVLHMKGGSEDASYAKNSKVQAVSISRAKPVLEQAVLDLCDANLPDRVVIADLGCSSGPNSLLSVSEITSIIYKRCSERCRPQSEYMVFLNDLPGNDFNTVFKSLTAFQEKMKAQNGQDFGACYVAGVPGSFHGRLFPSKTLNFVHSSNSLHWLSQVPPELTDKENPVINKGKIFISKTSPPAMMNAYRNQFLKDFSSFLKARSEEVVSGGRMVFTFVGRRTADPSPDETCLLWDYLGLAFQDLVSQGLIEEEKLDTYNAPYYAPYIEDVRAEVENEGSFTLDKLEITAIPWDVFTGEKKYNRLTTARVTAKTMKAIHDSMITNHFGDGILDPLFERFIEIMAADTKEVEHIILAVSLIRKY